MVRNRKRRVVVSLKQKQKNNNDTQKKKQEVTRLGYALRALGGLGGGALGGLLGQSDAGSSLGSNIGASISKWLGSGAYAIKSNSVVRIGNQVPSMHKTAESIIVRHREYIGDVASVGSAWNEAMGVRLNPGDVRFPWLRAIALNFTQYRWRGLVFHYVATSGNSVGSTTTSLGTMILGTHYDTAQLAPTSKLELLNEYYSNDSKPSESFCHPIECAPDQSVTDLKYVTAVPNSDVRDARFEDHGFTYICTQGQQAACTVGEVWATYEVELYKPKAVSTRGVNIPSSQKMVGNIVNTAWFGTQYYTSSAVPTDFNDHIMTRVDNNTLAISNVGAGTYMFTLEVQAVTALTPPTMAVTNATFVTGFGNSTSCSQVNAITGATAGWLTINWLVKVDTVCTVTFAATSGTGVCTAATYGVVRLQQISGDGIYA
jgi:hypothetical protein